MIKITEWLTPLKAGTKQLKAGKSMTPAGITYHNTGNADAGADANAHARAQAAGNIGQVAVHYYVDDKSIYRCLSDTEQGWHASDRAGPGNATTISIEVCENKGIDTAKANQNAAELGAYLLHLYKLDTGKVYTHQKFSPSKYCPHLLLPIWTQFMGMIKSELSKLSGASASTASVAASSDAQKVKELTAGYNQLVKAFNAMLQEIKTLGSKYAQKKEM